MKENQPENNNNQPYEEFSDLFNEEKNKRNEVTENKQFRNRMLPRHILAIVAYVVGMLVIPAIILIAISNINGVRVTVEPEEIVIESVASDTEGLGFVKTDRFNLYKEKYNKYISYVSYEDYILVVNVNNQNTVINLWLTEQEDGTYIVNQEEFNKYISNETTHWDEKRPIKLYISGDDGEAYPVFLTAIRERNIKEFSEAEVRFTTGALSVANFISYLVLLGVVGALLWSNIVKDFKPFKAKDKQLIIGIFTGVAIIFGAGMAANALSSIVALIFKIPGSTSANQMSIDMSLQGSGMPLMILTAVIIGPIVEELIFRKTFFELSRNKWVGLVVSSVIFGLIHVSTELTNLANFGHFLYVFIPYLSMGFGFGAIYMIYRQNVITTIGAHMIWNAITVVISLII